MDLASSASQLILRLVLAFSVPSLLAGYAVSPILAGWLNIDVWSCLAVLSAAFVLNLTGFYGGVMYGLGLFKHVAFQNIIYYLASRLPAIFLVYAGFKLFGVASGFLAGSIVCLAFSMLILGGRLKRSGGRYELKKVVSFSFPLYVSNIIGLVQGWLDIIILSVVSGLNAAGPYYLAVTSQGFISILWSPLSSALLPMFSSLYSSKGKESLEDALALSARIVMLIVLPVSLALVAVSNTAISITYGSSYQQAVLPFSILVASAVVSAHSLLYSMSLQALGYTRPIFLAGLLSTVIYVVCLALLSPILGSVGMAISRVAMAIAGLLILRRAVVSRVRLSLNGSLIVKTVFISIVVFAPLVYIDLSVEASVLIKAPLEFLLFSAILVISARMIKPLSITDRRIIVEALPSKLRFLMQIL